MLFLPIITKLICLFQIKGLVLALLNAERYPTCSPYSNTTSLFSFARRLNDAEALVSAFTAKNPSSTKPKPASAPYQALHVRIHSISFTSAHLMSAHYRTSLPAWVPPRRITQSSRVFSQKHSVLAYFCGAK